MRIPPIARLTSLTIIANIRLKCKQKMRWQKAQGSSIFNVLQEMMMTGTETSNLTDYAGHLPNNPQRFVMLVCMGL